MPGRPVRDAAPAAQDPVPVLFVHFGQERIRGSERCLLDLLAHLDPRRFRPFVWCNAAAMAREVAALGIPVETDRFTILLDWNPPRFDVARYAALVRKGLRLVRDNGVRLVHANSGAPNQWMVPVARAARVPLLAHLHAVYQLRERCTLGLHHAPLAVGVSAAVLQGLLEDGVPASRTRVVHNGIDLDRLAVGDASRLRADLGLRDGEAVVVGIGSLDAGKKFDDLLRALALLRGERRAATLLIAGDGPERRRLERLAGELGLTEAVRFLGWRDDVGAILRDAADIFASASAAESFMLTGAEAAAFGVPVVSTAVGGVVEQVRDGATGLLVPPNDPPALAAALRALVDDPGLRRRLGEAGRTLVRERFTIQRNVQELAAAYDELLERPRAAFGWTSGWGPVGPWGRLVGAALRRRLGGRRTAGARGDSGDHVTTTARR